MGTPICESFTGTYPPGQDFLSPGQSMTVTLVGHDSGAQTIPLTGSASNSTGTVSVPTLQFDLVLSEVITYSVTAPEGAPVSITAVPEQPGVYTVTAL